MKAKTRRRTFVALLGALLIGCSSGGGGGGVAPVAPGGIGEAEGPGCNPEHCEAFCSQARCLWESDGDGAQCMVRCAEQCGDTYFDETDAMTMACVEEASGGSCGATEACCREHFTNQLCP